MPQRELATFAYIEEPPFAWTQENGFPAGCDVELVFKILNRIGLRQINTRKVTFPDLIPGVVNGDWLINTPMFITPERSKSVEFTKPVWVLSDGFMVRENSQDIDSYESLSQALDLRVGTVRSQVQHDRAINAGVASERIQIFEKQEDAVSALQKNEIDVYIATSMGHRAFIKQHNAISLTVIDVEQDGATAFGGYSFARSQSDLVKDFNAALAEYIRSSDYRTAMISYGFTDSDVSLVVAQYD